MSELNELYQELILDHNKHPRNFGKLRDANREASGHNPLCGDVVHLYLQVEDGRIQNVAFEGKGCAISTASASLLTECVKGKTVKEAHKLFEGFHDLLTGKREELDDSVESEKLKSLTGVREFPVRIKCATLAWHTLKAALDNNRELVTTE